MLGVLWRVMSVHSDYRQQHVVADSPNVLTSHATIRRASELRNSYKGGGWNRVIVLGWNFAFDISEAVQKYREVEVLVIPPD